MKIALMDGPVSVSFEVLPDFFHYKVSLDKKIHSGLIQSVIYGRIGIITYSDLYSVVIYIVTYNGNLHSDLYTDLHSDLHSESLVILTSPHIYLSSWYTLR